MKRLIYCLFVLPLLFSGCTAAPAKNDRSGTSPTEAQSPTPLPSATPVSSSTPTLTPLATPTPVPTNTNVPTVTPSRTPNTPACTNLAEFVRHLSVSDNSKMPPNVYFAKVWRIKNVGTCTWTPDYAVVFSSGDDFGSIHETLLGREVKPGETVDIQVALRTPLQPNTYAGKWMLRDQFGNLFGVGQSGNQPISVQVVVIPFKINERKETLSCG